MREPDLRRDDRPGGPPAFSDSTHAAAEHLAHVVEDEGAGYRFHLLEDHLASVSELAAGFAAPFRAAEWARLAGRWHDLGKFQPEFQAYIRRGSGYDPEAHVEGGAPGRVDHSSVGAVHAVEHLGARDARGAAIGRLLAYVIAGHHAGLPDWSMADGGAGALESRLADRRLNHEATCGVAQAQPWLEADAPTGGPPSRGSTALWLRMVFSALVDADFLDTEAFMGPENTQGRSGWKTLAQIGAAFDHFMAGKARTDTAVNRARSDVLAWCREAAEQQPGLFSLTVPTGGGKTLSSMAFALRHALKFGKRRIVYVIPYTSIIEQTADVLRDALAEADPWTVLLEHHSNLDAERETHRSRLASENWDAPVVVTTSVQFFESLFAARTSRTRKLHNLAESVVILDEVQLLPADFLHPVLDAVQALAVYFGATILLMTATQPAWRASADVPGLQGVREIVADPEALHRRLKRVRVRIPYDLDTRLTWPDVATRLLEHPSVLCVVNRRQDARMLFELLRKEDAGAVHLSALMCGAHRSAAIASVRTSLRKGSPTRVVSTQLVEAGVDLDFPVVYRAMAGLDSIAQAAGRCNREGRAELGEVHVFVPPTSPPPGILRKAEGAARTLFADGLVDPLAPAAFERFFHHLYWLHGDNLDKHGIRDLLDHAGRRPDLTFAFRTAARRFRIIPDENQASIVVRWTRHPRADRVETAIAALRHGKPGRWAFRSLQRSTVTIGRWHLGKLLSSGAVEPLHDELFVQVDSTLYDDRIGLRLDPADIRDPEEFIS